MPLQRGGNAETCEQRAGFVCGAATEGNLARGPLSISLIRLFSVIGGVRIHRYADA